MFSSSQPLNNGPLQSTIAMVTGGASGLGAATAKYLASHGARVLIADLPSQLDKVEGSESFSHVELAPVDVLQEDDVNKALYQIENVFGQPLNLLVNCAGIAPAQRTYSPKKGPHSLDTFTKALMVNTVGSFNAARCAVARMAQNEPNHDGLRGLVVNTASIAAYEGQIGQVAYAASKGAIVGMTLPMARDLASINIRVVTIVSGKFSMLDHNNVGCSTVTFTNCEHHLTSVLNALFATPLSVFLPL
jgi:3-hydroxyacyl-CoA dehydrogenase / 3-hydroxy-2-methylbutyryl-CoA dehydrogenase